MLEPYFRLERLSFPETSKSFIEKDVEKRIAPIFEVVGEVRKIRSELKINPGSKVSICLDMKNKDGVLKLVRDKDIIFHLASLVGVEGTLQTPINVLDTESKGTLNLLNAILHYDVDRFIFASSSEVYGDSRPMKEKGPYAPTTAYGYAKLLGEIYCQAYHQECGIEYVSLRYFNIYGPRQDDRFVIPRFINRVRDDLPPIIFGNGEQTRDFTYVDDAVNMTVLSAIKEEALCEAINIGTGRSTSINELVLLIIDLFRKKDSIRPKYINYSEKRPAKKEIFNRVANISKAKKLLKYTPKIFIEEGLKKLVEAMK